MLCPQCRIRCQKSGKHKNGLQRYRCGKCGRRYTEPRPKLLGNMRIPMAKALLALYLLVEGNSIRSIERVVGLEKKTIISLMLLAGEKSEHVSKQYIHRVRVRDVQADEIWGFVAMKNKTKMRLRP
jgi:transposase-like protein/IS1 family transposase